MIEVRRALVAALVLSALGACAHPQQPPDRHHTIAATTPADATHALSVTVEVPADRRAPAGLTPITVTLRDRSGGPVRDAIVYAALDSRRGTTPRTIVVAANHEDGTYTADLPLVYDSAWSFTLRAFSNNRAGTLTVVEDVN
ncbi:MAG TPA: hypothetical protein VMA36_14110 [Candidatus Limnocylindria bacterium]|nr:hypothetical protein [Candidatus Limnocylindria bacterium]